jgi:MFS family permease
MQPNGGTDNPPSLMPPLSSAPPRWFAGTFRALRHRNYRLYFFGQIISLTGSWMQTTALMWLAFELTHESKWPAWISAAQILPTFLLGAWGGALADHFPRTVLLITQTLLMSLALALAEVGWAGVVAPWQLLVITALAGVVQAVDFPARLTFVMDLAGRDDLMNAVALNSMQFNVARLLGPAVSGPVLYWLGAWPCFLANGLSYLALLWALSRMRVPRRTPAVPSTRPSLLDGFTYLATRPALLLLVVLAAMIGLCAWPFQTLLPALAEQRLGVRSEGYSLMLCGTGFGALAAAFVLATFGAPDRRRSLIGAGLGVLCAGLIGLALARCLALAVASCALIGFGLILFFATSQAVVQLGAGDHNRGRVMGVWAMVLSGAVPLGNLLAGPAADRWGVAPVLWLLGLACATVAVVLLGLLRLWRRGRLPGDEAPTASLP